MHISLPSTLTHTCTSYQLLHNVGISSTTYSSTNVKVEKIIYNILWENRAHLTIALWWLSSGICHYKSKVVYAHLNMGIQPSSLIILWIWLGRHPNVYSVCRWTAMALSSHSHLMCCLNLKPPRKMCLSTAGSRSWYLWLSMGMYCAGALQF